jgi:hypothetical protein
MSSISDPALLINQLPISIEFPVGDDKRFVETLTLVYKRIANTVNSKEGGLYSAQEYFSNQQYSISDPSTFKNVYRKCFDMTLVAGVSTPIAAGTTRTIAHGISDVAQLVHMYGGAKNSDATPKFIPLPYVSATVVTQQVQIYITSTDVILVNGATQTALTSATVVVEVLKN